MLQITIPGVAYIASLASITFALLACGGGSSSSAPSGTISAVTASSPAVGKLTTFTISGTNLPASISPTTTGCAGIALINSSSATQRQFTCTPDSTAVGVTVNYGAPTPFVATIAVPHITSVTGANVSYGKSTTFTIVGNNLPAVISPSATGCSNLVSIVSNSSTSREFTCTPEGSNIAVSVEFGASTPHTSNIAVPLPQVTFVTSVGTVVVELYPERAPISVKNFLSYVNSSFYTNTIFHRVVPGFVSQGGGFVADASNKIAQKANSTAPIALESNNGLSNLKYTLAMARQTAPDTATSQFYFNAANNVGLDFNAATSTAGFAVFGKAISGTAVLDSMNAVANATLTTGTFAGFTNVPTTSLVLQTATRTQ
jgi:cyclophilin family peptidyl-prolyl cis-trans isomerase